MKNLTWLPFLLAATLAFGIFIGVKMGKRLPYIVGSEEKPGQVQNKVDEILRFINAKYMEDVNQDSLLNKTIDDILSQLDPHTRYISAADVAQENESLDDDFEGVGIEYMMVQDTLNVVSIVHGGPSESAGIMPGDKLISVEDTLLAGKKCPDDTYKKKLRGKKGTKVKFTMKRGKQSIVFDVVRAEIPNHSVDAGFMLNETTGYIKINRFASSTYKEFMEKIDTMQRQNIKNLIIDLRGNGGGYVHEAFNILNQLVEEKKQLMFYTKGLHSPKEEYKSTGQHFFKIENIKVLINENSASASEIVAGTLQDLDRATIIGRRSFGKGLVQEQFDLADGSALRMTTSQYFTASGRCIQKPYKGLKNYEDDLENRIKSGELSDFTKIPKSDSTKYYTKSGKIVHGGGGIIPDVFVPIEQHIYDEYFAKNRALISEFCLKNAERWKKEFSNDEKTFLSTSISENLFKEYLAFASQKGVLPDKSKLSFCKTPILTLLKANIGKFVFNDKMQYKVFAYNDPMIQKALEK